VKSAEQNIRWGIDDSQQSNQEITVRLYDIGDEPEIAKVFSCTA
jgi:hypothetical protein